jgi:hypothetical protein
MTDAHPAPSPTATFTSINIRVWDLGGTGSRWLFRPNLATGELAMVRAKTMDQAKRELALAYLRFLDATRELSEKRILACIAALGEPVPLSGRAVPRQWVVTRRPTAD